MFNDPMWSIAVIPATRYDHAMYQPPHKIQLKSLLAVVRTKHLPPNFGSQFVTRRRDVGQLRRLTGCLAARR